MKVIVRTDEYTIFQKRSQRYAVQDASRAWVNGDAKVAILLAHKLIEAPAPKAPEPEAAAEADAAEAEATETASAEAEGGDDGEKDEEKKEED